MKTLIVSMVSFAVGAILAHELTAMNQQVLQASYRLVIMMDTHARLTKSEYEFMTERSKNHLDMAILEGIGLLRSNLVYGKSRENLLSVLDNSVAYRYPQILDELEANKNPIESLEEGGRVKVDLGQSEGFDDIFNEVIDYQQKAIIEYYKSRLEQSASHNERKRPS